LEITPGSEDTLYDQYYAVGSGGTFAKQAMSSVAHHDLPNRNLAEAEVIVYRAIAGCIEVSAFGIGLPISICAVTHAGVQVRSEEELRGIADTVDLWKEAEKEGLIGLGLGEPAAAPEPIPEDPGLEPEPDGGPPAAA
jgi:hypothetical protein